jgi:hypothetical protein
MMRNVIQVHDLHKAILKLMLTAAILVTGPSAWAEPSTLAFPGSIQPAAPFETNTSARLQKKVLAEKGYRPWKWLESDCMDCELQIVILNRGIQTEKVRAFVQALSDRKPELIGLYGIHGAEYNLLAHIAVGIMGRESKFYTHWKYRLKEASPRAVEMVKVINFYLGRSERIDPNSRGPTQIKFIPETITRTYGIEPDDLREPDYAAIATMGYLIEALATLKRLKQKYDLEMVTPETYPDYLPYLYFGRANALRNRTATPEHNLYVKAMKGYMSWVELYEGPPVPLPLR